MDGQQISRGGAIERLLPDGVVVGSQRPVRVSDSDSGTAVLTRTRTKKPSLYRVLLLNDDYSPMEFVVHVLQRFFNKTLEEATEIMLHL